MSTPVIAIGYAVETVDGIRVIRVWTYLAPNAWMDQLQQQGLSTRPVTHAVHMFAFYRGKYRLNPDDFANAYAANDCSISLPFFHGMTWAEQDFVICQIRAG